MEPYVVVVGAANIDIWGRSGRDLIPRDSNPGQVRVSFGGVGRNIACSLRLLGVEVELLTALGGDGWAERVAADCREKGIGLRLALRVPEARTGSYLYITGPDGDMALAVCDLDIARCISPEALEQALDALNGAAAVVIDGNLDAGALDFLARRCTAPLFADPVSAAKAPKLAPVLPRIHTLKPNALEAAVLTGESGPARAAAALAGMGVRNVCVSDGPGGMYLASGGAVEHFPCPPARPVNATGGGDAAMAALVQSFLRGRTAAEAVRFALAAGAMAVECMETINPELCEAALLRRIESCKEEQA